MGDILANVAICNKLLYEVFKCFAVVVMVHYFLVVVIVPGITLCGACFHPIFSKVTFLVSLVEECERCRKDWKGLCFVFVFVIGKSILSL